MKRSLLMWYVAAGALMGGAFLHHLLWPLFLAGLVCWCFALTTKKQTFKATFFGGWAAGTTKMLLVLWWFWSTYPLEWMNIHPALLAGVLIGIYWLITGVVIGLGFAATTLVAKWFIDRYAQSALRVLIIPLALVAGEVLGSFLFSLYIWGPGATPNIYFSFGYLGYLLVDHGVLRFAGQLGSVYVLSYIAGAIGILLFEAIPKVKVRGKKKNVTPAVAIVLVFLLSGFITLPAQQSSAKPARVVLIGSNFGLESNPSSFSLMQQKTELMKAVERALYFNPSYILLPEASNLSLGSTTKEMAIWFASKTHGAILIDSRRVDLGDNRAVLRSFIYDPRAHAVYTVDKKYLAPQGEFVPYFYTGLFTMFGAGEFFANRTHSTVYQPAQSFGASDMPAYVPAVMFCSENLPPLSVFMMKQQRMFPFVAHPVSHNWFNSPYVLWNESRQMVALQALTNGVPVAQAGNRAPTIGFDASGREVEPDAVENFGSISVSVYGL